MQLALNPHVVNIKESATLAINQRIKQLRAAQEQVYHFGFGQSPFPVPGAIQVSLQNNSDKKNYLPTRGLPELLDAASEFYLPATHLATRVASVDYDGKLVLQAFPGKDGMKNHRMNQFFPNLVKGCDALEQFLSSLK